MPKPKIRFKASGKDSDVAYIELPDHPGMTPGCVAKTVTLDELVDYIGPRVHLDFDKDNHLIGIEILA